MFFMIGITEGRKRFEQLIHIICPCCGNAGKAVVYMTYTCLSLFFIPVYKWNKQYYVEMDCCGSLYRLNEQKGKSIAKGEDVIVTSDDLEPVNNGRSYIRRCPNCGYTLDSGYEYCPHCGRKL
ncbi:MAG: zinc ribbon domain-containing protein [Candidatus Metalachnospira sp.]|nr:zinc ribbon domain-containing protein [Candidatus Metalachnospira sp.]